MLILGLALIAFGALVIVLEIFTGDHHRFLGFHASGETLFFLGLASGLAIVVGLAVTRYGTRRSLKHRRDAKQLNELETRLEHTKAAERGDDNDRREPRTI